MSYYRSNHSGTPDGKFFVVCVILIIVLLIVRSCVSESRWNNGICSYCGGHYRFQQAIGHNHYTEYMYTCDKCGHSIEIAQHYPEVDNE